MITEKEKKSKFNCRQSACLIFLLSVIRAVSCRPDNNNSSRQPAAASRERTQMLQYYYNIFILHTYWISNYIYTLYIKHNI